MKGKAVDAMRTRGKQLDAAFEKLGAAIKEKVTPVAGKVTAKFDELSARSSANRKA